MTAEWFLVLTHHAAPSLLDRFRGLRGRSFSLFQPALRRIEALGAGLGFARTSGRCALCHLETLPYSAAGFWTLGFAFLITPGLSLAKRGWPYSALAKDSTCIWS